MFHVEVETCSRITDISNNELCPTATQSVTLKTATATVTLRDTEVDCQNAEAILYEGSIF